MEMHQLRYFAAVVDEGSFTAAAARLHVSQSGISTQVGKLERELGQQLLERSTRGGIRLSPAGEAILPLARTALASLDAIRHTAAEFAEAVRGKVRLGMITGCSIPPFLDVVADLGRTHPGIELSLHEDDSALLQSQVLARTLDLALIAFAGEPDPALDATTFVDEPIAAVVPIGHPLDRKTVRLADLPRAGEKILGLTPGTGIRAAYDRSCLQLGLEPHVDIEASSPATLLRLAERGAGVAVLSPSSAVGVPTLRAVPVKDAAVHACLGLVARRDQHSPAVRLLRAKLRKALGGA
ncbi:LysR family transcriptional regulator [Kitasatospora sp. NPDC001660]